MSERLPYEEQLTQQWTDLPLPDENMAWADMKRRLDEDDDDGGIIVWWRRGCGLWGLVLLVLLAVGWWIFRPEKWFTKSDTNKPVASEQPANAGNPNNNSNPSGNTTTPGSNSNTTPTDAANGNSNTTVPGNDKTNTPGNTIANPVANDTTAGKTTTGSSNMQLNPAGTKKTNATTSGRRTNYSTNPSLITVNNKLPRGRQPNKPVVNKDKSKDPLVNHSGDPSPGKPTVADKGLPTVTPDSSTVRKPTDIPVDSVVAKTNVVDSVKKKDSAAKKPVVAATPTEKKDSSKKKSTFFSAGIAVHQLIPVAGQQTSPYNSLGRKGTLLDYIPSVYVRFNKEGKWFIQAEFRYGVPQYTKKILYDQTVVPDTGANPRFFITTSNRLQKTYYHQLPVSFNYFIKPGWSIGGGLIWNRFSTAITDREQIKHNNITSTDSVIVKGIVKEKLNDTASIFAKSYFQAMFETQYQWKRFSIGARYSLGLEPFIRFTLPNGLPQQERNQSVQIFLRYQLWRSKSK
jgi:hypothetical protein